jgi:hypothetical protein
MVVMVALFGTALAVRLPWLMLVPRFEDEGIDLLAALDIARGHSLPLTGVDLYSGPLYVYLVAGMSRLFGENILWPRLLAAVFGALTVPATFYLGRLGSSPTTRWACWPRCSRSPVPCSSWSAAISDGPTR